MVKEIVWKFLFGIWFIFCGILGWSAVYLTLELNEVSYTEGYLLISVVLLLVTILLFIPLRRMVKDEDTSNN